MRKRILAPLAALAVAAAVTVAGLNIDKGSSTAEPSARPTSTTVPSPYRAQAVTAPDEPVEIDQLPQQPSDATTTSEPAQSPTATVEPAAETSGEESSAGAGESSPAAEASPSRSSRANRSDRNQQQTERSENSTTTASGQGAAELPGWRIDYFEGFDASIQDTGWERYGWGDPAVGHGAMGIRSLDNTFTSGGELLVRTKYENGQWSAGGASTKQVFTASQGRWEVRARFPQAVGIGYVFLLWPKDEGWPPEIDFAEGRVNGPEVMGVYHWDPDNKQTHRFFDNNDMHGWHTYGVIVEGDKIIFTFDGQEWDRIEMQGITDKEMFLAVQTGAMDPNGSEARYETVPNGVPGPDTPAISDVQIDWVAHYTKG